LTPAVHAKVDQILAADPDTLTAPDIASRATWADKFRDSDRHTSRRRPARSSRDAPFGPSSTSISKVSPESSRRRPTVATDPQ
jgi:hypothetical protein